MMDQIIDTGNKIQPSIITDLLNTKCNSSNTLPYRRTKNIKNVTKEDIYDKIPVLTEAKEICIDGMSGSGKTTLLSKMKRVNCKSAVSGVSKGHFYNIHPFYSVEYILFDIVNGGTGIAWDRCRYSNFIFSIVHFLMAYYEQIPKPMEYNTIVPILNSYLISCSGLDIVHYLENLKQSNIIFIVNSDVSKNKNAIINRDGLAGSSIQTELNDNYLFAQYHAYRFFAEVFHFPIIDLNDAALADMSLTELQNMIIVKTDWNGSTQIKLNEPLISKITEMSTEFSFNLMFSNSLK